MRDILVPSPNDIRGRDIFARFERLLNIVARTASLIPHSGRVTILDLVRNFPTRLGIALRYVLLRSVSESCGRVVAVYEGVYLRRAERIRFGSHVSVHPMCYLDGTGGLTIGDHVSIAHGVTIMTTEHDYEVKGINIRDAPVKAARVEIGNDVWIGAGAKILAGVTIGDHVVVGAGTVVTRNAPDHSVMVGVPGRVLKSIGANNETSDPV